MPLRHLANANALRRRRSWSVFWSAAVAVVGLFFFATLGSSGSTNAGLVLIAGFIVVGIAAALMYSIASPFPDQLESGQRARGGFDGGGVDVTGGDFGG